MQVQSIGIQTSQRTYHQVFKTQLATPMTRSLSDPNTSGAEERSTLGAGELVITRSVEGCDTKYICQMFGENKILKFEAIFPTAAKSQDVMQHSRHGENSLQWDATDTSCYQSNEPRLRRFTLSFIDGYEAFTFLLLGLDNNLDVVREFVTARRGSRFNPDKERGLPHLAKRDNNAMEIDGQEGNPKMYRIPYSQSRKLYKSVNVETQDY